MMIVRLLGLLMMNVVRILSLSSAGRMGSLDTYLY